MLAGTVLLRKSCVDQEDDLFVSPILNLRGQKKEKAWAGGELQEVNIIFKTKTGD